MSSTNQLKENDFVLCTVSRIESTGVFAKIEGYNCEGAITLSEISPGRIRNIREFVSVGKKIVCKVLRKKDDRIELSLRRVSAKDREAILEGYKKERIFESMLKSALDEKTQDTIVKIKEENDIADLFERVKSNPDLLKKYLSQTQLEKLKEILSQKKETEKEVKKKIILKSDGGSGINHIKEVLETKDANISYLGSSQFLIKVKSKEYKTANTQLEKILSAMKEKSKAHKVQFEILK